MSKIFAISDIWFNRLLMDTPNKTVVGEEEHIIDNVVDNNEYIIMKWNETVSPEDKVYVLGGFGISDLYQIAIRLNGEIHFLNNIFNDDEKKSIKEFKNCLKKSSDSNIKSKFFFENEQIVVLNNLDAVLSYLPIETWLGKNTGTYCFHGLTNVTDFENHNITCMSSEWNCCPVNIEDVQKNILSFNSKI